MIVFSFFEKSPSRKVLIFWSALLLVQVSAENTGLDGGEKRGVDEGLPKDFNSKITTNPACQADVVRICGKTPENLPDLDALECILNQKVITAILY